MWEWFNLDWTGTGSDPIVYIPNLVEHFMPVHKYVLMRGITYLKDLHSGKFYVSQKKPLFVWVKNY